jgi:phosphoenolpyruvate---glycerone phosphotransferase subunit DhaK
MKKLINAPEHFVNEMIEGILVAHPDQLKAVTRDRRALARADAPVPGKVGIVTGGGSGHLPVFLGYVGKGLADAVAVGNVFASPSARQMYEAIKAVHGGAGVLCLYGNYFGDVMNFDTACEMADADGIETRTVLVADDVASAPRSEWTRRRGIAGLFFAYKLAGAKAEAMGSLAEVERVATETVANTATMGVALSPCTVPEAGKPTFAIGEDEMEIGMGIHGEAGVERTKIQPADQVVTALVARLVEDLSLTAGDQVAVLVNGLGATPLEELYIVYRKTKSLLDEASIRVHRPYIGEFATSLEMGGASITFLKLNEERRELLDAPAASPFFTQCLGL